MTAIFCQLLPSVDLPSAGPLDCDLSESLSQPGAVPVSRPRVCGLHLWCGRCLRGRQRSGLVTEPRRHAGRVAFEPEPALWLYRKIASRQQIIAVVSAATRMR